METIINYLDTMFAKLPNTEQVRKAREELLQMMEDKYSELIAEGKSPNEAVGTVISEFGNLEELSQSLGLEKEMEDRRARENGVPRRMVTLDEATEYLQKRASSAFYLGLGICLCIICVVPMILFEGMEVAGGEAWGLLSMALLIAAGVLLIVFSNIRLSAWSYLKKEPCEISMDTTKYVKEEIKHYSASYSIELTVGVLLNVFCWLPAAFADELFKSELLNDTLAPVFLFFLVGIGVLLIVHSKRIMNGMEELLKLNEKDSFSANYGSKQENVEYIYPVIGVIMSVFWPTVTCLYLIWSFLSFDWYKTWIIWPLAAVISAVVNKNLVKRD